MSEHVVSGVMPVIPLRGLAIFPETPGRFDVGRPKSLEALNEAMSRDQIVFLVPQKRMVDEDPGPEDLCTIGTVARVVQILRPMKDVTHVLVSGICRGRIQDVVKTEPFMRAKISAVPDTEVQDSTKAQALRRQAKGSLPVYISLAEINRDQSFLLRIADSSDAGFIADSIASVAGFEHKDKMKLLCQLNPVKRLENALKLLHHEIELLRIESKIHAKTRGFIDENQKEYYLREQIRAIRDELGESDDAAEFDRYAAKIRKLNLAEEVQSKLLKDLDRLKKQPFGGPEGAVLRTYLDTVLELPWNVRTKERIDVEGARKILDHDHFGLQKVKERILETLAVRQIAPNMPPQIICLVGPPGVGKTSIAYSISRCLNRKMARIALGGVRDEADIRGHRKAYVGAMPGRIINALIQAGSSNPLLLLDEIDKMGSDYRGDPSAALLEVLDAEQNSTFRDHYMEIPFDLSDVMFITTANTLDTVPRPLLDRMEIIELGSYTDEEKVMIAKNHLIPKQLEKHGIKKSQLRITEDAIREIISGYTRESGVRNLERSFADICRKAAMQILSLESSKRITVTPANLEQFLGIRRFVPERLGECDEVGLVTGLAWTSVGGDTLEVEVNVMEGTGKLELTGNLGDVMKESAHAALSYIRANAEKLGVDPTFYKTKDIHVHFPEGAVPKDGPSAGVTVCTAIVSALTGTTVRRDVAMTGEISLRGRVMAIGGLKEKTMAALRRGITTVIIPADNERDLKEIDQTVRGKLHFVLASSVDTVLETALNRKADAIVTAVPEIPGDLRMKSRNPSIHQ